MFAGSGQRAQSHEPPPSPFHDGDGDGDGFVSHDDSVSAVSENDEEEAALEAEPALETWATYRKEASK